MQDMTPNQPYLLKAFYDWIVDNGMTPYLVVDANYPNVQVPTQFVNDGQIVLNVSPNACVNFSMGVEFVEFQARFGGQPMVVSFPCAAVGAIYSKENGAGSVFTVPEPPTESSTFEQASTLEQAKTEDSAENTSKTSSTAKIEVVSDSSESKPVDKDETKPTKPKNKPGLRVVK